MYWLTDIVRNINDPEHPLTLEELKVVEQDLINVRKCLQDYYIIYKVIKSLNLLFILRINLFFAGR